MPLKDLSLGPDGLEGLGRRRKMTVVHRLKQSERRIQGGSEPRVIDGPNQLPPRSPRPEPQDAKPMQGNELMGEQADDGTGVVTPFAPLNGLGPGVIRLG